MEDAALSLGSRPTQAFFRVILPVILPSLTAGALLVFMATMADFGTPMVLGEGLRTLPTLMYGEFINELGGNPTMASTLGSLLILINTVALMAQRYWAFRKAYQVVCLRPLPIFRQFVPSKVFEVLAAGRPLVAALAGEAAEIVREAGGLVAEPGDGRSIAAAVRQLLADPAAREAMGERGRRYVREHYDRQSLALDYLKTLKTLD